MYLARILIRIWGCSSIGRAPRLHRGFLLRVRVASAPRLLVDTISITFKIVLSYNGHYTGFWSQLWEFEPLRDN